MEARQEGGPTGAGNRTPVPENPGSCQESSPRDMGRSWKLAGPKGAPWQEWEAIQREIAQGGTGIPGHHDRKVGGLR